MKNKFLVALIAMVLIACKKENVVTYSSNTLVAGLWTGQYSAGSSVGINWTADLKADGVCRVYETKVADTSIGVKLDGVYNISEGKLKIFAGSTGSFKVKYDGILNNNSLNGTIVWNYIANSVPTTLAGVANLVKQ